MSLGELLVLAVAVTWIVRSAHHGRHFEQAWIGFFVGLALMLARRSFLLGAVVAGVSFAVLSLPAARAEWQRLQARRADQVRRG